MITLTKGGRRQHWTTQSRTGGGKDGSTYSERKRSRLLIGQRSSKGVSEKEPAALHRDKKKKEAGKKRSAKAHTRWSKRLWGQQKTPGKKKEGFPFQYYGDREGKRNVFNTCPNLSECVKKKASLPTGGTAQIKAPFLLRKEE